MSDFIEKQKNEFEDFINKWETAVEKGLFDSPKLPDVNHQTSTGSFFGFNNTNNTDEVKLSDNEYWNAINSAADDHDPKVINENKSLTESDYIYLNYVFSKKEIEEMSPETRKNAARAIALARNEDRVEFPQGLRRSQKQKIVDYLNKIVDIKTRKLKESLNHKSSPSNPIARDTLGCDQNMNPQSLGQTYSEDDLIKLSELKKDLYDLESKLMTSMGFGDDKNQKKIENKIQSLKKEIHKISDDCGKSYKNEDQPKQLENL